MLEFLKNVTITFLIDLTAIDYLPPAKRTKIIYLLHNPESYDCERKNLFVTKGANDPLCNPPFTDEINFATTLFFQNEM